MAKGLPILCLDFDGVVHDYREGWKDGSIYGTTTPGFQNWAAEARRYFTLIICSSRTNTAEGVAQVKSWLKERELDWIDVVSTKPPAFLTIDDRGLLFSGSWDHFNPRGLRAFQPWGAAQKRPVGAPEEPVSSLGEWPANPAKGDFWRAGGKTYEFDGDKWVELK